MRIERGVTVSLAWCGALAVIAACSSSSPNADATSGGDGDAAKPSASSDSSAGDATANPGDAGDDVDAQRSAADAEITTDAAADDANLTDAEIDASLPLQGSVHRVSAFTETAINDAITAANSGDTVDFPAGTYPITTTIALKAHVLYHGEPGAILESASGVTIASATSATANGISLDGLIFDGGNLTLGDDNAFASNVTMVNCTIRNVLTTATFSQQQGVLLDHIDSSRFEYNTFTNDGVEGNEAYAIIVYTTNRTSFSHNTLTTTFQGFHFESADTTGGNNLTVSDNVMTGLLGIGIEFNKDASQATITGNRLSDWRPGDANGLALSIVPSGSDNTIENNYASGAGCSTCNIGIEASGSNSLFEDNTIDGFYTNIAISCAPGSIFSGNTLSNAGMWGTFDKDGGYCTGYTIGTNTINGVSMTGYPL